MNSSSKKYESVLKIAEELFNYGKTSTAVENIIELLNDRKNRTNYPVLDEAIKMLLTICLNSQNSTSAREGLIMYKNIVQRTRMHALKSVVLKYLNSCDELITKKIVENNINPESVSTVFQNYLNDESKDLMMSYYSLNKHNIDSNDSSSLKQLEEIILVNKHKNEISKTFFKLFAFIIDNYYNIIDILKNNDFSDDLYCEVFKKACIFCKKYSLKTYLYKLAQVLVDHSKLILGLTNDKYYGRLDLSNAKAVNNQIDLRLKVFECLLEFGIFNEAFHMLNIVYNFRKIYFKDVKMQILFRYKIELTHFCYSMNLPIYHSLAFMDLFHFLFRSKQKVSESELKAFASRAMLALLAVPLNINKVTTYNEIQNHFSNNFHDHLNVPSLNLQFSLNDLPLKSDLFGIVDDYLIKDFCSSSTLELFYFLESKEIHLDFCKKVQLLLEKIKKEFNEENKFTILSCFKLDYYFERIRYNSFFLFFFKMSKVFDSMSLQKLLDCCPYYSQNDFIQTLYLNKKFFPEFKIDLANQSICFLGAKFEKHALKYECAKLFATLHEKLAEKLLEPSIETNLLEENREKWRNLHYSNYVEEKKEMIEYEINQREHMKKKKKFTELGNKVEKGTIEPEEKEQVNIKKEGSLVSKTDANKVENNEEELKKNQLKKKQKAERREAAEKASELKNYHDKTFFLLSAILKEQIPIIEENGIKFSNEKNDYFVEELERQKINFAAKATRKEELKDIMNNNKESIEKFYNSHFSKLYEEERNKYIEKKKQEFINKKFEEYKEEKEKKEKKPAVYQPKKINLKNLLTSSNLVVNYESKSNKINTDDKFKNFHSKTTNQAVAFSEKGPKNLSDKFKDIPKYVPKTKFNPST